MDVISLVGMGVCLLLSSVLRDGRVNKTLYRVYERFYQTVFKHRQLNVKKVSIFHANVLLISAVLFLFLTMMSLFTPLDSDISSLFKGAIALYIIGAWLYSICSLKFCHVTYNVNQQKKRRFILVGLIVINVLTTLFLLYGLSLISMFYPEDQYVDMLRLENEYMSMLLSDDLYFKIEDEHVYLSEHLNKMETIPVQMNIPTSFMILDESGSLITQQEVDPSLLVQDVLLFVSNQPERVAYYPLEYNEYPYFCVNQQFSSVVDSKAQTFTLVSILSAEDLGNVPTLKLMNRSLLFTIGLVVTSQFILSCTALYFVNSKIETNEVRTIKKGD